MCHDIYPEDYDSLEKPNASMGALYQMALLVNGVLEGMLRSVVDRINESCGPLITKECSCTEVDYEFRNAFECVSWLEHANRQQMLFEPKIDVKGILSQAAIDVISEEASALEINLVVAWYWDKMDLGDRKKDIAVTDLSEGLVYDILFQFLEELVVKQMKSTCAFVNSQIRQKCEEFRNSFEYEDEDGYIEYVLQELCDERPDNPILRKALCFATRFLQKELPPDADSCVFSITYKNNGERRYYQFELHPESMSIYSGGYTVSDCGGDSYGSEVWRLNAYSHRDGGFCDVLSEAIELLSLDAEIVEDEL